MPQTGGADSAAAPVTGSEDGWPTLAIIVGSSVSFLCVADTRVSSGGGDGVVGRPISSLSGKR